MAERSPIRILHTNDVHARVTEPQIAALLPIRAHVDLYVDTGDVIRTGNLGLPMGIDSDWQYLRDLRCDVGTIGNRETHVLPAAFHAKIDDAPHTLLCANLISKKGPPPLPGHVIKQINGYRVGILGVSVAMVTRRMATQAASFFLWDPPVEVARDVAREIRPHVDVVIALTHIGHRDDCTLAESCPEIDLIFGGHSHTVLQQPEQIGTTWIAQGGSYAKFYGLYEFDPERQVLSGGLHPWVAP